METEGPTPLSKLLNEEPPLSEEAPVVEAAADPEPAPEPEPDGPARDEKGRFAAKTGVDDTPPPGDQLPPEEYKAIREEREKRQSLERQVEALNQQIQTLQQPKDPPPPPPSLWEDEQGWSVNLQRQIMQQTDQLSRINASEMAARGQHADFQEMFDLFNTMAGQNPAVVQQAMADPHPWGKAYQIAKNYKNMQELGAVDLADLEAKMRDRIMAEMQAGQTPVPQPQSLPPTITGERNVGDRGGPAWAPKSLEQLLPH